MKKGKIKVTEKLKKLLCVPLLGLIMATTLAGCSEEEQSTIETVEAGTYDDKIFNEGEHIVVIPIDNPLEESKQYEYHEGYKVVGISSSTFGKISPYFDEAYLVYENEYPVKASVTAKKDDKLLYTDFGTPIEFSREKTTSGTRWKEFNEGEHIISVPLEDMNNENYQIDYYDGYEVIGIATSSYGKIAGYYAGGCVLYKNTQKVKCVEDDEGKCTTFGIPVEETKILEK